MSRAPDMKGPPATRQPGGTDAADPNGAPHNPDKPPPSKAAPGAGPSPETAPPKRQPAALGKLTTILELSEAVRRAQPQELPFIFVNATRQLFPYRQAVYWTCAMRMRNASGLAVVDAASPYGQWMDRFARLASRVLGGDGPAAFDLASLPATSEKEYRWLGDWKEWLPRHGVWREFRNRRGAVLGALALFREEPFTEGELRLLSALFGAYGETLAALSPGRRRGHPRLRHALLVLAIAAVAGAGFIPVRNSSLAPAEVVAKRPEVIRSTLDGVVDRLWVEPNQSVSRGDVLLTLDDTQLRTRLMVARKAEDVARVEYQQIQQQSLSDPTVLPRLPLVQGRLEQLLAESEYIESLLERVRIPSPIDGVVLSDSPDEWLRHPVTVGQKILMVANPEKVELEITLPMAEMLDVQIGDSMMFYSNAAPAKPVEATVTFVGFRAQEMPGVGMAFRIRADFAGDEPPPMLGRRGMGKLYGQRQNLATVILRRPLLAVRQWLGW